MIAITGIFQSIRTVLCISLSFVSLSLTAQSTDQPDQRSVNATLKFVRPQPDQIDTAQLLVPNSAEITYDVQSAFAHSKHQRGVVGEWQYVLFPDGSAIIRPINEPFQEQITVSCELAISCIIQKKHLAVITVPAIGAPRPDIPKDVDGMILARFVAESILAGTGTKPIVAEAEYIAAIESELAMNATREEFPVAVESESEDVEWKSLIYEEKKIEDIALSTEVVVGKAMEKTSLAVESDSKDIGKRSLIAEEKKVEDIVLSTEAVVEEVVAETSVVVESAAEIIGSEPLISEKEKIRDTGISSGVVREDVSRDRPVVDESVPEVVESDSLHSETEEIGDTGTASGVMREVVSRKNPIAEKHIPEDIGQEPLVAEEESIAGVEPEVVAGNIGAGRYTGMDPGRRVHMKNKEPVGSEQIPSKRTTPLTGHADSTNYDVEPKANIPNQPLPIADFKKDESPLSFSEKYKLSYSVTSVSSLAFIEENNPGTRYGKPRVILGLSAKLSEKLSGRVALVGYIIPDQQEQWDPDFTYSFSYKFSDLITMGYSNYSARFQDGGSESADSLVSGSIRGSYSLPSFKLFNERAVGCSVSLGLSNPESSSTQLYCGVKLTEKHSIAATAHFYIPGMQESGQPDFSYTATYKISKNLNINYSNYGNNRFPWNKSTSKGRGIYDGALALTFKF